MMKWRGGTVTFKYDPLGRRIEKISPTTTSIFAYDGDELIEETNATSAVVARYARTRNIDEPLAMLRGGTASYYQQDWLKSITSLSTTAGALAQTYTYDSFGKVTASGGSLTNGSSINFTAITNNRMQPCWIYATTGTALSWSGTLCTTTETTAGNILDLEYSLNFGSSDNGNVMGITNNRDSTRSQTFTYDYLNRIATGAASTYAVSPPHCWGESYTIDRYGNLSTIGSISSAYNGCTQDNLNILVSSSTNRITTSGFTYDLSGNLTSDGTHSPTYDAEGHMISDAGVTYYYDADGKRVQKSSGTLYWYGTSPDPLLETNASGSLVNEYTFFGGKRISRRDSSNNIEYYFADEIGSARVVTNSSGTILEDCDYFPYGGSGCSPSSINNYLFTGKERDSESGLANFGARYNSSQYGRFMIPDPENISAVLNSDDPQSWDSYAYGRNNPLRYTDPEGLNYMVCNRTGGECADLTDEQYKEYRQDNPEIHATPSGNLYVRNEDGSETKVGSESYYDEKIPQSLQQAGRISQIGVNYAMAVTAPNYLLVGGAHILLSGSGVSTLGITPKFVPWVATSPALAKLINMMYQEGDQLWDGTAGAVRTELATGEPVGGVFHSQKAQELINGANNLLKSQTLSGHDQQVARAMIQKLSDALGRK
jgi:RHS repeat-associated protein